MWKTTLLDMESYLENYFMPVPRALKSCSNKALFVPQNAFIIDSIFVIA